ncbi:nucleotide-sugar transporter [Pseudozyma hubeiensis SY62]|uniref:Nucleotide-sugar transporter n=1 Tax=Pseudozyma hubeiensis (strain SY62) TaxID=1305764 RepID=R9PLY4_PSEHS|nr:nucleotide-sugar transporter [Pseudozyma hubeiensis SY62]GAC99140.1 nucleotide-sugar transporter [Pseudozyma hubeiensis SY62]
MLQGQLAPAVREVRCNVERLCLRILRYPSVSPITLASDTRHSTLGHGEKTGETMDARLIGFQPSTV